MDNFERFTIGFTVFAVILILSMGYIPIDDMQYENEWKVIEHKGYVVYESDEVLVGQTVRLEEFSDFLLFLDNEQPTTVYFVAFKPAFPVWMCTFAKFYFVSDEGIIYQYP